MWVVAPLCSAFFQWVYPLGETLIQLLPQPKWKEKYFAFWKSTSALPLQNGIVPSSGEDVSLWPALLNTFIQKMWVKESCYPGTHCKDGEKGFQNLVFNIRKQKADCSALARSFHWKKMASFLNLTLITQYHLLDQKSCISAISSTLWSTCNTCSSWIWNTYSCCPNATSKIETLFLNSCWICCTTGQSRRVRKFAGTRTQSCLHIYQQKDAVDEIVALDTNSVTLGT